MTIQEILFTMAGRVLMTVHFLLLALQLSQVLAIAAYRRKRGLRLYGNLHFLLGFALFFLMMLEDYRVYIYPDGSPVPRAGLPALPALPALVWIAYEVITAAAVLLVCLNIKAYRRNHPTFESVKETMDLLPVGIAFFSPDGQGAFCNLTMDRIFRALTGKPVNDLLDLTPVLPGAEEGQVSLPDGSVWYMAEERVEVDGSEFFQLTASDVTRQAAITKSLAEKNEKLKEMHLRLSLYNRQADRIIIAQELLTARMAVHSEVGNVLLESRHYLADPASFKEEMLLQALKNTNTYLLREYEQDDTDVDPLAEAMEVAEAIGVDVILTGLIPQEEKYRSILAAAVNECASNTVKHAAGSRLLVEIRAGKSGPVYILKNNGRLPKGPIREGGGLSSLRSLVETAGGRMETAAAPAFSLTIELSGKNGPVGG